MRRPKNERDQVRILRERIHRDPRHGRILLGEVPRLFVSPREKGCALHLRNSRSAHGGSRLRHDGVIVEAPPRQEKMFQPCALGISHDEQKINPRIIILH